MSSGNELGVTRGACQVLLGHKGVPFPWEQGRDLSQEGLASYFREIHHMLL